MKKIFRLAIIIVVIALGFLINATRNKCHSSISFIVGIILVIGDCIYIINVIKKNRMDHTWILIALNEHQTEKYMLTGREYVLLPAYKKSLYKKLE